MSAKITVNNLKKVEDLFKNLKKRIKPKVIDRSLGPTLQKDLEQLKKQLLDTVNNEIKTKITIQEQDGNVEDVVIKKSDKEQLQNLTGVDLEKVSKTRDYSTLADGKLAIVSNKTLQKANIDRLSSDPTSKMSSGINLRLPMSADDTFENQYGQALKYYNQVVVAIVDNLGNIRYYYNPGIDMSQYVKIVCSNKTGDSTRSREVFERYKNGTRSGNRKASNRAKNYADWTLTKEGLDRIRRDFIDMSEVFNKLKQAEYDEAKTVLIKNSQKANVSETITEKIDNLKDSKKLDDSVASYNNVIRLIKNLVIKKTVKKDRTFYELVSNYDENMKDYESFQKRLVSEVKMWKISNEQKWVKVLVDSIINLVKKLLR